MVKSILPGLALVLISALALAQESGDPDKDRQYVTDQLRLSLYAQPNSSSEVLKLLQSGDLLEIEQIQGPYALVTAPGGTRGWVKRGFLVNEPTANLLLREEQQKTASLAAEIEKLGNSKVVIDQYEQDMDKMVGQIDQLEAEKAAAEATIAELEAEIEARQAEIERKDQDTAPPLLVLMDTITKYWEYVVPAILVIVFISFLVSKEIVEARIRAKFHGIKIW